MSGVEFTAEQVNEALQRLDWTVERDDSVVVVGLNNGAGTPVPPLLASAYNVLSIGRSDGRHSTGVSSFEVDGVGRIKPELVAPMTATSWSTAVVSSCAALLREAAAAFAQFRGERTQLGKAVLAVKRHCGCAQCSLCHHLFGLGGIKAQLLGHLLHSLHKEKEVGR